MSTIDNSERTILNEDAITLSVQDMNLNQSDKATLLVDEADLEYDEDFASLVVGQNNLEYTGIDDDDFFQEDGNGQFASEMIEEDFEAELGAQIVNQEDIATSEIENKKNKLKEQIDRYAIINVCGTDKMGRPIIVVSACKLPDIHEISQEIEFFQNQQHFFETLLEVGSTTLEQYVEAEYTLVYLHHGLRTTSQPSFNWLAKVYKMLDRKFKKNLKALYVVHPTTFIKFLWQFFRPIISSKVNKKVTYCSNLAELSKHIDLEALKIPKMVKTYDAQLKSSIKNSISSNLMPNQENEFGNFQQFKVSLESIASNNGGDCIPLSLKEAVVFIRKNIEEEGIFRKSGNAERIRQIKRLYNDGQPVAYDQHEVHVAACVLKAFFSELPESLLPESLFDEMATLQALDVADKVDVAKDLLKAKLPKLNYNLLKFLIGFLSEVASHSAKNKMNARNISTVLGPNFLRHQQTDVQCTLSLLERINNFVELLIKYNSDIFD